VIAATVLAHYVLPPWQPVEFFTSAVTVLILYPALRLLTARKGPVPQPGEAG
jgi:hypothetical protein